ncbi:MAG: flagellar basal body-associated FliL family protein [candidate division Zixibacteria bacterium]|nr:flagellar basal body-associated FliL family protein [candidate division Zixibacteria bacterium]MDH3939239.1 flagellar basal body-associated FliL family protein [candidate division Zixibacteria bacterium]MDH4032283.1 flagellar basal body-associated FliL family protein [candidate division Zixibacteria bacterium]
MADEEKTTMETGDDTTSEAKAEPKGGKKKLFILGGVGLVAVVVGLVVALFVIKPMLSDSSGDQSEQEYAEETDESHGESAQEDKPKPKKKKPRKKSDGESEALIYAIRDIVVNPAGTGGSRFLSVSFGFELESPEFEAEFAAKEAVVRDALITILSSKTVAQLTDSKQKEIVRYQIKKRVSKLMGSQELVGVYFTDFVLQ